MSKRDPENISLANRRLANRRFENLAYGMLGSVADAEDVVQEARLKVLQLASPPLNPQAYLFRVVTNLALDRLRRGKVSRAHYRRPWLPEPLPTERIVELAHSLSIGLLMMLERLSPAERVVFVFREGFDLGFTEIADVLEIEVLTRQARPCRGRRRSTWARKPVFR